MVRVYSKPNYYTIYSIKNKLQLVKFIEKYPIIIKELEKCMSKDISYIFKEKTNWYINSWINSPRIKNPKYIIMTHKRSYIGSFRYHYDTTNNIYDILKVKRNKYCFLSIVLINSKYRGKHLCTKMINNFVNKEKRNIVLKVLKTNIPAIKCYEKCNFKKIGKIGDSYIYIYFQ